MKRIYLDYAATTPTHPSVVKEILPYFSDIFGNASSIHSFGQDARAAVENGRRKVADLVGATTNEIVFTSGGTESNNFAIKGVAFANEKKGNHIIISPIEHHAISEPCEFLAKRGFEITILPVDKFGIVDPNEIKKAITSKTILISVMHANNEIGSIQPIEIIGKIAKENNVIFHTDAVQTAGALPIDVNTLNVDLLSMSAHKLYGPKGIGALYIRKGTRLTPLLHGGAQEMNRRGSTENVPGIVGFGKAAELAKIEMPARIEHLTYLRNRLMKGIENGIEHTLLNGHPTNRLPNNVNYSIEFIEGESILLNLDMEGIAASTGSACSSASLEPSHVLLACGRDHATAHGSMRFSLGRLTTEEEIDHVLDVFPKIVDKLRRMSPLYKK